MYSYLFHLVIGKGGKERVQGPENLVSVKEFSAQTLIAWLLPYALCDV